MTEQGPRLDPPAGGRGGRGDTPLDRAIADLAAAVVRRTALDSVVTEAVRLRCARVHDCRLCGSLRLQEAADAGFDGAMAAAIDRYEESGLDERVKVALRLTDAMISTPVEVPVALRDQVHAHFSPEQMTELVLDIVKWSCQKALVALRIEPPAPEEYSSLSFDEAGNPVISAGS